MKTLSITASNQMSLFEASLNVPDYDNNGVNRKEAPEGFYATLKTYKGYNICNDCDARQLCVENHNQWCFKNRCMSYEVTSNIDGKVYKRNDGKSVIFKRIL